ncbi:D-alanyl-D-alanine carboxypeptidase family protein [Burkholderiaceae bacterium DAT-1]|nr:D-alanyl-D-alanine carboxypeptidase family protein [Burkholderiaceae bacterium DAT-1]
MLPDQRMFHENTSLSTNLALLGIPADYGSLRRLTPFLQAESLVPLGLDCFGRDQFATPEAASAWFGMRAQAQLDGIELQLVSAFRSIAYQTALIRRKLDAGQSIDDILRVSAAPGYSEHHTGRALDISTPGFTALEAEFEQSDAYRWLLTEAGRFGFTQSYPRNNPHQIDFEPWHWCYHPQA